MKETHANPSAETESSESDKDTFERILNSYGDALQSEDGADRQKRLTAYEEFFARILNSLPQYAEALYTAMAASPVTEVRRTALRDIDKLMKIDRTVAREILYRLTSDDDPELQEAAFKHGQKET